MVGPVGLHLAARYRRFAGCWCTNGRQLLTSSELVRIEEMIFMHSRQPYYETGYGVPYPEG